MEKIEPKKVMKIPCNNWELLREWHPDYKSVSKTLEVLSAITCQTTEGTKEDYVAQGVEREFLAKSFAEALEAFALHIHEGACKKQREICAEEAIARHLWVDFHDFSLGCDGCEIDKDSILDAATPEFELKIECENESENN